ncbi:hypothetical protein BC831DRAFT_474122 [Entophlyctis helioformis]|nr:hypothetical protein BC831DRAFT_474122 [Entophlyctis helioformis]
MPAQRQMLPRHKSRRLVCWPTQRAQASDTRGAAAGARQCPLVSESGRAAAACRPWPSVQLPAVRRMQQDAWRPSGSL